MASNSSSSSSASSRPKHRGGYPAVEKCAVLRGAVLRYPGGTDWGLVTFWASRRPIFRLTGLATRLGWSGLSMRCDGDSVVINGTYLAPSLFSAADELSADEAALFESEERAKERTQELRAAEQERHEQERERRAAERERQTEERAKERERQADDRERQREAASIDADRRRGIHHGGDVTLQYGDATVDRHGNVTVAAGGRSVISVGIDLSAANPSLVPPVAYPVLGHRIFPAVSAGWELARLVAAMGDPERVEFLDCFDASKWTTSVVGMPPRYVFFSRPSFSSRLADFRRARASL